MLRKIGQYTTKAGYNLEYSVAGQGEPILIMHGGHSNCNEEFGYLELTGRGYSVITPSRPGYGKTSKEIGEHESTSCDSYLELLDHLKVPQVHIIAISAGGPSGIHFASKYPQRVRSLTLQSAVTHQWLTPADLLFRSAQLMFHPYTEKYLWKMLRFMNMIFPAYLFRKMVSSFSQLNVEKVLPQISEEDKRQFKSMINRQRSGHGFKIDLKQTSYNQSNELSAIQCPTLILHSRYDASVPVEHAHYAQKYIPNAQLYVLESWGHLIWIGEGAADMYHKLFEFLDNN
ncbi:alpha/beta hydrolase [Paenibacillus sp. WST5]|uniref:Alpha/beta hydrolase n=2 Tax=Paenibacillus sedimenti TaxID=2770274 RepID=A0A926QJB0_9BACL|nr:alpha/beta hydrolase [Paenibacillus sedimenti]